MDNERDRNSLAPPVLLREGLLAPLHTGFFT